MKKILLLSGILFITLLTSLLYTCKGNSIITNTINIDFAGSQYPALVKKWGYNSYWNVVNESAKEKEVSEASKHRMTMAAGLVELTNNLRFPRFFCKKSLKKAGHS